MNNLSDQQAIWMVLSDLFIDNEVDYNHIAEQVVSVPIDRLEQMLFYEVAPICMSNLLVPTPSVYAHFDEDYVIPEIEMHLEKMLEDKMYQYKINLKVKLYKVFLRQDWSKIRSIHYQLQNQSPTEQRPLDSVD